MKIQCIYPIVGSYKMKIALFMFFSFFSSLANCQVDSIVYDQSKHLTDNFGIGHFSTLILKDDGTFLFQFRASSCTFWYDKRGAWDVNDDTLKLTEQVLCEHVITKRKESMNVLIKFLIDENELIFIGYTPNVEHFKPFEDFISTDFTKRITTTIKK